MMTLGGSNIGTSIFNICSGLVLLCLHVGSILTPQTTLIPNTTTTNTTSRQVMTSVVPHISGNHFIDSTGQPVTLRGASRWSLEFSCQGDHHFATTDFQAMASWGMNAVRIPLNSTYWLSGDGHGCRAQQYHTTVANAVKNAESVGLFVLLVGQWSVNRSNAPMAYRQDRQFLKELAIAYTNDDHVGFVPVTEPHNVSWDEWYHGWNGGPGMREMVAILNAGAPNHLIFVNGIDWADNLDFLTNGHVITGPNIAYEVHIYQSWKPVRFDPLLAMYPIIAGEFGINDTKHDYSTEVMQYFEAHGTGYFAWAWTWVRLHGACDTHALLACGHWDGTPTTDPTGNASGQGFGLRVQTFMRTHQLPVSASVNLGNGFTVPAMGWNHYNTFGNGITETTVHHIIDAMATNGMLAAGYHFINLDDSWQGTRDRQGNIQPNSQFPSGIKALADYAHSKGFSFGIYTTPGTTSCGGHTGSRGHIQQDVQSFASWGVDYIKLDICSDARKDTIRTDVRAFEQAIHATGHAMVLSLSSGGGGQPWTWAAQEGLNSWRTGGDICQAWISTVRDNQRHCYHPPDGGVYSIITSANGSHLAASAAGTGIGHVPDPDMLEIGTPGLTFEESKSQFAVWSMVSAPLIAGNDPHTMSDATRSLLLNTDVIAIDQDSLVKAGVQVRAVNGILYWVKPLADGGYAVLLLNSNDSTTTTSVQWHDLGLGWSQPTRDLWAHQSLGAVSGWAGAIPAHGVMLFRIGGATV